MITFDYAIRNCSVPALRFNVGTVSFGRASVKGASGDWCTTVRGPGHGCACLGNMGRKTSRYREHEELVA